MSMKKQPCPAPCAARLLREEGQEMATQATWDEYLAAADAVEGLIAGNETLRAGYDAARLEIASLKEQVQSLGQLARDVNSRRVLELEAQLEAVAPLPWVGIEDGVPPWTEDASVRVLVVTADEDFGGPQMHDVRAVDFWAEDEDGEVTGTDVTQHCTHWAYRDDMWPQDRHALQDACKHPAPCARHCEAQAFSIEIRSLQANRDAARLEIESLKAQHEAVGAGGAGPLVRHATLTNEGDTADAQPQLGACKPLTSREIFEMYFECLGAYRLPHKAAASLEKFVRSVEMHHGIKAPPAPAEPTPTRPHHLPRGQAHCHGTPAALCGTCLRAMAPGDPRWQPYFAAPPLDPTGTTCPQHLPTIHGPAATMTTTPQGTPT